MTTQLFNKISLVGIGLIGSSLARVIKDKKLTNHLAISTRRQSTLDLAKELNLADYYSLDLQPVIQDSDLVIMAVPVDSSAAVARQVAPFLKVGSIVTDVGSTKEDLISQLIPLLPEYVHFIPGHPIAGTEKSGPAAGFADLFNHHRCILTPLKDSDPAAVDKLIKFWQACGSTVDLLDARYHDRVMAVISHLPHLLAYSMVGTAAKLEEISHSEIITYAASGFRDFTRLAGSDPVMWRDIFLHNKDAVLQVLSQFTYDLNILRKAIENSDGTTIEALFANAKSIREKMTQQVSVV